MQAFNDIKIPQEIPEILCIPETFGYNQKEADELFPYKKFEDCENLLPTKRKIMSLDLKHNLLTMNCTGFDYDGKYVLGESSKTEMLGLRPFNNPFKEYNKPATLTDEEYAYATCDKDKKQFLENVEYHHRAKKEVLNRTSHQDPVIILSLTLDSVSRRSFYRRMNKTVDYLNSIHSSYQVFDMKIHNVMGEYSADNIMPQLLGDVSFKMFRETVTKDFYYDRAIWKFAKEKGFASLFIEEGCSND